MPSAAPAATAPGTSSTTARAPGDHSGDKPSRLRALVDTDVMGTESDVMKNAKSTFDPLGLTDWLGLNALIKKLPAADGSPMQAFQRVLAKADETRRKAMQRLAAADQYCAQHGLEIRQDLAVTPRDPDQPVDDTVQAEGQRLVDAAQHYADRVIEQIREANQALEEVATDLHMGEFLGTALSAGTMTRGGQEARVRDSGKPPAERGRVEEDGAPEPAVRKTPEPVGGGPAPEPGSLGAAPTPLGAANRPRP